MIPGFLGSPVLVEEFDMSNRPEDVRLQTKLTSKMLILCQPSGQSPSLSLGRNWKSVTLAEWLNSNLIKSKQMIGTS